MSCFFRSILISLIIFFTCHSSVYAKLFINEFSSFTADDWIELYSTDPNPVELENYCIRDDSTTNKLVLEGTLSAGEFILFNWTNKLNKSDDTIKLFFNCDESQPPLDHVTYGKPENDVNAPKEGQIAGRKTDGGEEWSIFAETTAGKPNTAPQVPTETPILTNTPTPSLTPTPTKTPTSTPTPKNPTPTKIPTPIKSVPTIKPKSTASPTPKINLVFSTKTKTTQTTIKPTRGLAPTAILGIHTNSATLTSSPQKTKSETLIKANTDSKLPTIIISISIAVLLISCAILFFIKRKKSNQES